MSPCAHKLRNQMNKETSPMGAGAVYIVGHDHAATDTMGRLFASAGLDVHGFPSPLDFLHGFAPEQPACVILEMRMPQLTGLELLSRLRRQSPHLPAIVVTAHGDVPGAVRAMKLGAAEFLEKPAGGEQLLGCVQHWIGLNRIERANAGKCAAVREKLARLSPREREVLSGVLDGRPNKEMARGLGIGPKTIEMHRAKLMGKMGVSSVAALIREALVCHRQPNAPLSCGACHAAAVQPRRLPDRCAGKPDAAAAEEMAVAYMK
jgi:two-component system, LuxR family, response regulator FixJ